MTRIGRALSQGLLLLVAFAPWGEDAAAASQAACSRLVADGFDTPRAATLDDCVDRLAASPARFDENGYKLARWGDQWLASDGISFYRSADGAIWAVVHAGGQPVGRRDEVPQEPPPMIPVGLPAIALPAPAPAPAAPGAADDPRYRMWLALARRCDPTLEDAGRTLPELQFMATECERRLRQPVPADAPGRQGSR